ncbi:MAG: acyl-CoA dehydrogenase family protein [Pseudomonadales bacterium]|nr:acyl-CoA dehydrogenase family protein [Pseudomonadales bacterium]
MNLELNGEDLAFQEEVRGFLDEAWPRQIRTSYLAPLSGPDKNRISETQVYFDALIKKQWSVPDWPLEYGGTDWTVTQKYIWDRETASAGCPVMSAFGVRMLAPVLYTWASEALKKRHLPAIREASVQWCQGYSEPGAGSDLASLQTKAVLDGDHYIVNGAKTWTSSAHNADWIFCLVRTDPDAKRPQQGISFLLIDMRSPGVEVHPIYLLGNQHTVNSVSLTDVKVPVENLVGEENKGWTYAKGLLTHERTGIAGVARSRVLLQQLRTLTQTTIQDGGSLSDNRSFVEKVDAVDIELMALEITELRTLATVAKGGAPGPESSILKLKGTEISQRISDLKVEALGYYALPYPDQLLSDNEQKIGPDDALTTLQAMLFGRASTIFGGATEIQKNIVAKAVLGL